MASSTDDEDDAAAMRERVCYVCESDSDSSSSWNWRSLYERSNTISSSSKYNGVSSDAIDDNSILSTLAMSSFSSFYC